MISKTLQLFVAFLIVAYTSGYIVTWEDPDLTTAEPVHHNNGHRLGEKMCTRGPAYWCHNITQAKECHAVKHCIKKVWETTKLPEDNDSVCNVCKEMVKEARDQLLSNETEDEIRQVFEGSCKLIPLKLVADECVKLADDFIPELVDTLASRMDPEVVCAVSGLCNSVRIDEMLGEMKEVVPKKQNLELATDSCPKCNYYIGKSISYIKNLSKLDMRNKILGICGELGSYSDSCRAAVTQEFDVIYSHIVNDVNSEELCGLLGLCHVTSLHRVSLGRTTSAVKVWSPPQSVNDDLPCDFCKQLVLYARNWLVANNTKEEFQQIIEGLCKQTGKFRDECLNLAKQYGEPLYKILVDDMDPQNVCQRIGVCTDSLKKSAYTIMGGEAPIWTILSVQSLSSEEEQEKPMMKLIPGDRFAGDDEMKPTKASPACEFCEYALHEIQNYLQAQSTDDEIKEAVSKLCSEILPSEMASQCKDFVDDYGDQFIALLSQQIDPSQVCPKLRICTSDPMAVGSNGNVQVTLTDIPTCPICHFVLEKMIHMIGGNITEASIDAAMEKVCHVLPRRMEPNCESFMQNYGDRIAEMLLIEGTAQEICAVLHLCLLGADVKANTPVLPYERYMPAVIVNNVNQLPKLGDNVRSTGQHEESRQSPHPTNEKRCIMCEFVISKLDTMLQDNATEQEIKDTVQKICTYLPKSVRDPCSTFVDEYGDMVITYLAQSMDPAEICTQLGICTNTIPASVKAGLEAAMKDLKMDNCEICMVVADYLSVMLKDPTVENSIEKIVEKICPAFPTKYQAECKAMIEDYGPYLMSLLAQETDKGRACSLIDICPAPQVN